MPAATTRKSKAVSGQLCFSFFDVLPGPAKLKQKSPKQSRRMKNIPAPAQKKHSHNVASPFEDLCLLLHRIAVKHVSRNDFSDVGTLVRCTGLLKELGLSVDTPSDMQAPAEEQDRPLVLHAPQYRLLRSRAIAGLATVADLMFKAPAKGSADYQKGQRAAFQHASEIAAMFLEDVSKGV